MFGDISGHHTGSVNTKCQIKIVNIPILNVIRQNPFFDSFEHKTIFCNHFDTSIHSGHLEKI